MAQHKLASLKAALDRELQDIPDTVPSADQIYPLPHLHQNYSVDILDQLLSIDESGELTLQ